MKMTQTIHKVRLQLPRKVTLGQAVFLWCPLNPVLAAAGSGDFADGFKIRDCLLLSLLFLGYFSILFHTWY